MMKKTLSGIVVCSVIAAVIVACCGSVFAAGRNLSYGDEGDDVLQLQVLLANEGYFFDDPTGYFGEITEGSLIDYQYDMGLDPDGVAGPITQGFLGLVTDSSEDEESVTEMIEVKPVQTLSFDRVLTRGMEGKDVTALQQLLTILGYFDEEATGFFGDLTYAAVVAFQEDHDLDPDGAVGPFTVQVLITTPGDAQPAGEVYDDYAQRVLSAIDITPPTSAGYCASWVTQVLENAGVLTNGANSLRSSELSYAASEGLTDEWYSDSSGFNANDYWAYLNNSGAGDLAPGMVIATRNSYSYLGKQFGHVGIYIGDGQVISSVGYLETLPVDEWIDRYNNEELGSTVAWGYVHE